MELQMFTNNLDLNFFYTKTINREYCNMAINIHSIKKLLAVPFLHINHMNECTSNVCV